MPCWPPFTCKKNNLYPFKYTSGSVLSGFFSRYICISLVNSPERSSLCFYPGPSATQHKRSADRTAETREWRAKRRARPTLWSHVRDVIAHTRKWELGKPWDPQNKTFIFFLLILFERSSPWDRSCILDLSLKPGWSMYYLTLRYWPWNTIYTQFHGLT